MKSGIKYILLLLVTILFKSCTGLQKESKPHCNYDPETISLGIDPIAQKK